jgi:hypothetical protein
MVWRNSLLIGALIAAVAILVLVYIRRGLSDLQGQIDDIETVLAAMPPALTSGQFNADNAFINPMMDGGAAAPHGAVADANAGHVQLSTENDSYAMSEQEDEEDLEYDNYMPQVPAADEYSLDESNLGVASLVEPGVYQSGVVELTVLADNDGDAGVTSNHAVIEEVSDEVELDSPTDGSDNEEGDEAAISAVIEATTAESAAAPAPTDLTPLADVGEEAVVGAESEAGDEFDILTLPELKARLKATQPQVKAIGRMKRAEVLDRLRSNPEVEDADDN